MPSILTAKNPTGTSPVCHSPSLPVLARCGDVVDMLVAPSLIGSFLPVAILTGSGEPTSRSSTSYRPELNGMAIRTSAVQVLHDVRMNPFRINTETPKPQFYRKWM